VVFDAESRAALVIALDIVGGHAGEIIEARRKVRRNVRKNRGGDDPLRHERRARQSMRAAARPADDVGSIDAELVEDGSRVVNHVGDGAPWLRVELP
jgi:hypothetical protein